MFRHGGLYWPGVPIQKEEERLVFAQRPMKHARLYDMFALLIALVVVTLDQWTKWLVVTRLSPPNQGIDFSLIGQYLVVDYIQNRGAAFSILENTSLLAVLIAVALAVIVFLYVRMLNNGPLRYKLIFGLIIGGALGNLVDRLHNGGYVVDFIFFRIPQIHFNFAVFNLADASISVGVFLLFIFVLFGGKRGQVTGEENEAQARSSSSEATSKK
jgi:signal peptidase II